jgi:2-C-methyl-D-erythritol 4-phosphate cytidylyltransferase
MSVAALIVAAGRGRRLGGEIPKQYIPLAGRTPLRRSVENFLRLDTVTLVLPVIHPDDRGLCTAALAGLTDARLLPPVHGGETRARSVRLGLEALGPHRPERVLIHDAARPFTPEPVLEAVIAALDGADGACAALPVVDALWREEAGRAAHPVPRDGLWRAQTPQGFRYEPILAAHRAHDGTGADDVAVAREAGLAVALVPGSERNYKITNAADLARAREDAGET